MLWTGATKDHKGSSDHLERGKAHTHKKPEESSTHYAVKDALKLILIEEEIPGASGC